MRLAVPVGKVVRGVASDITPLRESAPFRRLFAGQAVSLVGTQVTQVAVAAVFTPQVSVVSGGWPASPASDCSHSPYQPSSATTPGLPPPARQPAGDAD